VTGVDWAIVAGMMAVLLAAALHTRRYTRSVAAFLAAERAGGRYLISVAHAMAGLGVITLVWYFEQNHQVGYTSLWWGAMTEPALIVLALSGWVIYRFRQTRAMTLAQFFEMRYSRNFRVFAGLVAYFAGIVNFGIFPSVGARFFISLCSLPERLELLGTSVPTYPALMLALLATSLLFTFLGGLIAVMVTDFLQGVFANIVFVVIMLFLLWRFPWEQMSDVLLAAPPGESLVHPFDLGKEEHFNVWYYVIAVVITFYGVLGWQGTQGYNCCAKDAHEAKMAGILNGWRFRVLMLVTVVAPIAVRTFLEHPVHAEDAASVHAALAAVDTDTLRNQLRTPFALAAMLPAGLLGLFAAAMLAAFVSTHDTYLHSWGSILVQDVVLPFRRRPFTPRQHLWLLRASIFAVAVFIFLFSLLFEHTQYLAMFLALTGAVFVGGAGAAIIGGLYWKRGTAAGAWAAMITGMTVSAGGIVVKQVRPEVFEQGLDGVFWLNAILLHVRTDVTGQELTFFAIVCSVAAYVLASLLGPRHVVDMDRLLHRGEHAMAGETSTSWSQATTWLERLGISREFTGGDRIVTYISVGWPIVWTAIFLTGTVVSLLGDVSDRAWLRFWRVWTWVILVSAVAIVVWFAIGGWRDLRYLFRSLQGAGVDEHDDGRVDVHLLELDMEHARSHDDDD
jgi:SSS family solute:Na+ symporter